MYIIELVKSDEVVGLGMIEKGNVASWVPASSSGYQYCSKFRTKENAQKIAPKVLAKFASGKSFKQYIGDDIKARVVSEFGTPTTSGSKGTVGEKPKDRVRR